MLATMVKDTEENPREGGGEVVVLRMARVKRRVEVEVAVQCK